jgi:hypothetical protein
MVITLDRAVNAVPRRIERKVNEGSPSSLTDTRNFETSYPEWLLASTNSKTEPVVLPHAILDDRMAPDVFHVVFESCIAWRDRSLDCRLVDAGFFNFTMIFGTAQPVPHCSIFIIAISRICGIDNRSLDSVRHGVMVTSEAVLEIQVFQKTTA